MTEEKKVGGEKKPMTISFKTESVTDKKGIVQKDPRGNVLYRQHDVIALKQIFSAFDGRKHEMEKHKICVKLDNKINDAWVNDKKEIELSLDQASFLKEFLKNLATKALPQLTISLFVSRTVNDILEQLK